MKLFNVTVSVQISFAGNLAECKEPEPRIADGLPDDPVKATGEMMQRYLELTNKPAVLPGRFFANGAGEGLTLNQEVQIQARDFSELQSVLAKFHDLTLSLTPEGQFELADRKA